MPSEKIPFVADQASGLDPLMGASPVAMNVIVEADGAVQRRPGVMATTFGSLAGVSEPVQAIYDTATGRKYMITGVLPGTQNVYELLAGTQILRGFYTGNTRPIIAETEAILAVASGRRISKVDFSTNAVSPLAGPPPDGSHVISQNSRLLANDAAGDRTKIHYSAPTQGTAIVGHEQWGPQVTAIGTSGFFTAEGRVDPIVAIGENSSEVLAFGTTSLEAFQTDAQLIYVPVGLIEHGCAAPYSVIRNDQKFAWLDDKRRFVMSDGRSAQVLSGPIQQTLQDLATIEDCFGYRVTLGPVDALVWTFPTDGRTFAYQIGGGWATWMGYDDGENNWQPLRISAHTFIRGSNENLVGTLDGVPGVLSMASETDLGQRIVAHVTTGFLNRGTDMRKACRSVRLGLRRGSAPVTTAPSAVLQYRDDEAEWRDAIHVDLGRSGDRQIVVEERSLGVYRRRQWRFNFADTTDLVLAGVTEEYEVLAN